MQTFADTPLPPQPGFDVYSLPPAPPKKIVEYTMLDPPAAEISGIPEKAAAAVTAF